jgi:hypothetical protein
MVVVVVVIVAMIMAMIMATITTTTTTMATSRSFRVPTTATSVRASSGPSSIRGCGA